MCCCSSAVIGDDTNMANSSRESFDLPIKAQLLVGGFMEADGGAVAAAQQAHLRCRFPVLVCRRHVPGT